MIRLFFLLLISLYLSANEENSTVFVYNCNNNYNFVAELKNNQTWLFLPSKTVQVNRVQNKTGAMYRVFRAVVCQ